MDAKVTSRRARAANVWWFARLGLVLLAPAVIVGGARYAWSAHAPNGSGPDARSSERARNAGSVSVPDKSVSGSDEPVSGSDEPGSDEPGSFVRSSDLARDLRRMWQTEDHEGFYSDGATSHRVSSDRAIHAASRVFNTVDLRGLSRAEVIARVGDPATAGDSWYRAPFCAPPPRALTYRFDSGSNGWQFDVVFDDRERVARVDRRGID